MSKADRPYGVEAAGAGNLGKIDIGDPIGDCPSCGASLHSARVGSNEALTHPVPFCHYFGATDPDQIVRDMKKKTN